MINNALNFKNRYVMVWSPKRESGLFRLFNVYQEGIYYHVLGRERDKRYCLPGTYRVSHFKVPQSKSILKYVISIFMIFYGAYYVHHIIAFCFLPYFSKKYSEGGSIELLKTSKKFFTFFCFKIPF